MKNKLLVGTVLTGILLSGAPVMAAGNATVEFAGKHEVNVGETFTVYMNVADVQETDDGVVSFGGNLSFDETKLEYVSSKGAESPYSFQINEDYGYKIAGLDFTLDNGIREDLTVYEFTFKALEEGNATITLTNAVLTDSKEYIDTNVISKDIVISLEKETVEKETEETKEVTVKQEEKVENNVIETEDEIIIEASEEVNDQVSYVETKIEQDIFTKIRNFVSKLLENIFKIFA